MTDRMKKVFFYLRLAGGLSLAALVAAIALEDRFGMYVMPDRVKLYVYFPVMAFAAWLIIWLKWPRRRP